MNFTGDDSWIALATGQDFWAGVLASMVAAAIIAILIRIFRSSLENVRQYAERGKEEGRAFEEALSLSGPYAPFAFGVAQGRGLRMFVTAVVIAYVGEILGNFIWPFHVVLYFISLIYLYLSLGWFAKIEKKALSILRETEGRPKVPADPADRYRRLGERMRR